jgi:hypothetical protein
VQRRRQFNLVKARKFTLHFLNVAEGFSEGLLENPNREVKLDDLVK